MTGQRTPPGGWTNDPTRTTRDTVTTEAMQLRLRRRAAVMAMLSEWAVETDEVSTDLFRYICNDLADRIVAEIERQHNYGWGR